MSTGIHAGKFITNRHGPYYLCHASCMDRFHDTNGEGRAKTFEATAEPNNFVLEDFTR